MTAPPRFRRGVPPAASQTLERAIPRVAAPPDAQQSAGTYNTDVQALITEPGGKIVTLVTADLPWIQVTVTLETAGPVEVSTRPAWQLLTGNGQALITNVPMVFTIPKGNKLYIASPTQNRIKVTTSPLPWMEQLMGAVMTGFNAVARTLVTGFSALRGRQ